MSETDRHDAWSAARSYEEYMGRWSRALADRFVGWLGAQPGLDWVDVGCGTGALTAAVLDRCEPRSIVGVDPSDGFVGHARQSVVAPEVVFAVGPADRLPVDRASIDVVASALAYNFVPDRPAALSEFRRALRPGGHVALYVWDYPSGGLGFVDAFWKAAAESDGAAAGFDEAGRFSFCTDCGLAGELLCAGFGDVRVEAIDIPTPFADFDSFWHPFTLGAGPAPGYLAGLDAAARRRLRDRLRERLGAGPIELSARAWAVRASI